MDASRGVSDRRSTSARPAKVGLWLQRRPRPSNIYRNGRTHGRLRRLRPTKSSKRSRSRIRQASELGRRDAMTMVLVDAVRNVVRGAEQAVGRDNDLVTRFNRRHPTIKTLRDRFEHYEDYVRGTGDAQRTGKRRRGQPLTLDGAGIEVGASEGGGPEGHLIRIEVVERDADDQPTVIVYEAPTRQITIAVRQLARDLLAEVGLLDERHLSACEICIDPEGI